MKGSHEFESVGRKTRVVNLVELGELVYIRLDDGKKYLHDCSGCWRCGTAAGCFGNMSGNELEVVCEFGFFEEVRSLYLVLLGQKAVRTANWLCENACGKCSNLLENLLNIFERMVKRVNVNCVNRAC